MKKIIFCTLCLCAGFIGITAQELELKTLSDKEVNRLQETAVKKTAAVEVENTFVPNAVTLDLKKAVGEIPFTSSVSATGAMTCNVPIEVYPGVRGIQPQLALSYNHFSGNSITGVGWQLAGISSISRVAKNIYYDGKTDGIRLNKEDAFALDGVRLIKLSESATQIKYETETGNIKVNAYLSGDVIVDFDVFYSSGTKGKYGYAGTTSNKLQYPITLQSDLYDNTVEYIYDETEINYRIKQIKYANASVDFQYTTRSEKYLTCEAGIFRTEDLLLQKILCNYNNTVLHTYQLDYQLMKEQSALTQLNYTATNTSLNPLQFYYGSNNNNQQYIQKETQLMSWFNFGKNPGQIRVIKGKFDYGTENDGIVALQNKEPYAYIFQTYFNRYNGSEQILFYPNVSDNWQFTLDGLTTGSGFVDILCANLEGSDADDVIKVNNEVVGKFDRITFKVYTKNLHAGLATKYTRTFDFSTVLKNSVNQTSIHPKYYFPGDFNGDGKMEILAVSINKPMDGTNDSTSCYLFDLENNTKLYEGKPFAYNVSFTLLGKDPVNSDQILIYDCDGDGKSDICLINKESITTYRFEISGSNYNLVKVATDTQLNRSNLEKRYLLSGDFNGDGKIDLALSPLYGSSSPAWSFYHSQGNGRFYTTTRDITIYNTDACFYAQDINGDGVTDLIKTHYYEFWTFINKNNGSFSSGYRLDKPHYSILIPTDIRNHGVSTQVICLRNDGIANQYIYPRNDSYERSLTGIASSHGIVTKINYSKLNSLANYTPYKGAVFPYQNFNGPIYVPVSTQRYVKGNMDTSDTYRYSNAIIHKHGLGFCGFEEIEHSDNTGKRQIRIYDPFHFDLLKSDESYINNTLITSSSFEHSINIATNKIAKIRLIKSSINDYLKNTSILTNYKYDTYGYPTNEAINYGDGVSQIISKSYYHNTSESNYLLGFAIRKNIYRYRNDKSWTERYEIPEHDQKGLPLAIFHYINGEAVLDERFLYNKQGNLTYQSQRNFNSTKYLASQYKYDNYGRIIQTTDPLKLNVSYIYNPVNGRLSEKQNHHGYSIYYKYDDLGRITTVQYPDKTEQTTLWLWDNTCGLYKINQTATGKPTVNSYFDALGREIRNSSIRFDGVMSYTDKIYDNYGRLEHISLPYTAGEPLWNSYSYDRYDRVSNINHASGNTDSFVYDGNSITSTQNGITSAKIFDSAGNLIKVIDAAGEISYQLRPDGQPESIIAPGNIVTSFAYDNIGRQSAIIDPSAGKKSFTYDIDGNVATETDANGQTTTFLYDNYNRLVTKKMPEFTIHYRYDTDGRLVTDSIDGKNYKSYIYNNKLSRLSREVEVVAGQILQKQYYYEDGNVKAKSYSDGFSQIAAECYYYKNGYPVEILLNDQISIWRLEEANDLGQPTQVTTGSFTRDYRFDQYGIPTNRRTNFMHFGYEFDSYTGNLLFRDDYAYNLQESFNYDNLDRLTAYGNNSITYDEKGNITKKSDAGTFYYETDGKPYAMSGADITRVIRRSLVKGKEMIVRDTLQAIPLRDQYIKYTSFNRPAGINEGDVYAEFKYDGNGQRLQMELSKRTADNGSSFLTRTYISDCYENDQLHGNRILIENGQKISKRFTETKEKLYLGGNAYTAPAVYVKENGNNWKIYYICCDYLGSITHITDENGKMIQELSYDAWGRLRNPTTHTAYKPGEEPDLFLGRGYTGHEHLPDFGLINMNARLYGPATGRFLSPDPYVQNPFFSQNFNRYSYGLNNPLKYTDSNGEFVEWIVAGIIVGFTYLYNAYNNGDKTRDKDGHQKRNYDLGSWAWNPKDWFKPSPGNPNPSAAVVVNVNANSNGDYSVSGSVGNPNGPMPTFGYDSNQGLGYGMSYNGTTNMYYPRYNYNAPEQGAANAWDDARFYGGLATTATSEMYYSKTFETWMGKNGKFYNQSWGGNSYTGGKYKFAQNTSKIFTNVGRGIAVWNAGDIVYQYGTGNMDGTSALLEMGSVGMSTKLPGPYGAAWAFGWEFGREITKQSWYQEAKFYLIYNYWESQVGPPSNANRSDWVYFYNNYKP